MKRKAGKGLPAFFMLRHESYGNFWFCCSVDHIYLWCVSLRAVGGGLATGSEDGPEEAKFFPKKSRSDGHRF